MEKTAIESIELSNMVIAQQAAIEQLQANELEGSPKSAQTVALLDDLREELVQWHAQWKPAHTPQPT